ncbi:hypothetical protein Y1Q_0014682 [Alligator mississippiensis]|uniref:Uncharacterized protein n=1 Tax=Alligator mississippiensis TaxID=8496 RepID=A0A151P867_ALLMI|nr:hypothetical protein Y1Q_0014682 [Alligator mississippiensis]
MRHKHTVGEHLRIRPVSSTITRRFGKEDGEGRMGIFTAQLNYLAKRSIEDTEQEGDDILCDFPFRNHGEAFGDAEDVMQATVSYTVKQTSNVKVSELRQAKKPKAEAWKNKHTALCRYRE